MGVFIQYIIYGLHSGDGVIRYVGRSIHGKNRLYHHRASAKNGKTNMPVHKWMRSIGIELVQIEILEECSSEDELPIQEDYWIESLGTHVSNGGLNVAKGHRGGNSVVPISDETRLKMKRSSYIRLENESLEQREKRLDTLRANGKSKPFLGRKHSEESKQKQRAAKLGMSIGATNPNAKLSEEDMQFIRDYPRIKGSINILAEMFNVSRSTIDRHRREKNDR